MDLAPQDLLAFAAVARAGGVRRAATLLDVPRSTLSRQLAGLEKSLGGRVIARSTRRFAVTELGAALLEHCTHLEDALAGAERVALQAVKEPMGTLRVAASEIIGEELLPDVLAAYAERFPNVRLDVRLSNELADLRRANLDLAVRTGPLQDATDLFATRLGASPKGLYASRAYFARRGTPETPGELTEHACIVVGTRPTATWTFRGSRDAIAVSVSAAFLTDSYRLAREAAVIGLGIARLPNLFAAPLVDAGRLVPILERSWERTVLYAVHAAGQPAPTKIRAFIELLRDAMKRRLET